MTAEGEVDDIRAEWLDRFGPLPAPAEGLLAVARLRVECLRTGVREVSATARPAGAGVVGPGGGGLVAPAGPARLCRPAAGCGCGGCGPRRCTRRTSASSSCPWRPDEAPVEALTALLRALVPAGGAWSAGTADAGRRGPGSGRDSSAAGARR